jgi:hypothetical protein
MRLLFNLLTVWIQDITGTKQKLLYMEQEDVVQKFSLSPIGSAILWSEILNQT